MIPKDFLLNDLKKPVKTGSTRSISWRRQQLLRIEKLLEKHEDEILGALAKDLGKPSTEALFEIIAVRQELKLVKALLPKWMKARKVEVPFSLKPGRAFVQMEPLGCVLIIGPWNYPFSLTIQPLISALAAGNTAVLKPSEHAPNTSKLIKKLFQKYFPNEILRVFEGNAEIAENLVEQPFDHIFFTGGGSIGKRVMQAASRNLTPITLELGGKSPAIVLNNADLDITARRLIWGKSLNAGQTCIAPDHLLVVNSIRNSLLKNLQKTLFDFYGPDPINSPDLARIVNSHQFQRLYKLLEDAREKGTLIFGGEVDTIKRRISPALIAVEDINDPLMKEEIFGPILPVLTVSNLEMALAKVREQPQPLALYMFGGTTEDQEKLLDTTTSGTVCFNDVILQAGIPELPFGGVGPSGVGRYHGKAGFDTFSNLRSIFYRPFWLDFKLRYPPYKLNLDLLKKLLT